MRIWIAMLLAGCTKAAPTPGPLPAPADARVAVVTDQTGPGHLDASVPVASDAVADAALIDVIEVKPVAMAGPYKSLEASCMAARPCGFTKMGGNGMSLSDPPTEPDCSAVLDPSHFDRVGLVPSSIDPKSPPAKLVHATPAGELRIGAVTCSVPKGLRSEHSEHYAFVQRGDGWWRTTEPLFTYSYNDKYCGGGLWLLWNTKGSRTIAGIAAAQTCLTCYKAGDQENIVELMVRFDTSGATPAVFAPLPVGSRSRTTVDHTDDRWKLPEPDCKDGKSVVSVKERWLGDDEVELTSPAAAVGGPLDATFQIGYQTTIVERLARSGRYKFTR